MKFYFENYAKLNNDFQNNIDLNLSNTEPEKQTKFLNRFGKALKKSEKKVGVEYYLQNLSNNKKQQILKAFEIFILENSNKMIKLGSYNMYNLKYKDCFMKIKGDNLNDFEDSSTEYVMKINVNFNSAILENKNLQFNKINERELELTAADYYIRALNSTKSKDLNVNNYSKMIKLIEEYKIVNRSDIDIKLSGIFNEYPDLEFFNKLATS